MKTDYLRLLNPSSAELDTSPVAGWLSGENPLTDVEFFPVQTKRLSSLIPWLLLALFFLAWVIVPLVAVGRTAFSPNTTLVPYLAIGALAMVIMFAVFLVAIFSFLWREYQLTQAQRHGRLRHGVFLGANYLLVRQRRDTLALAKALIDKIELVEERKGQRLNEFVVITLKEGEDAVRFIPETELSPPQLVKRLRLWRAYPKV